MQAILMICVVLGFGLVLFICLLVFSPKRMNYSETASASLQRLARTIEERLRSESSGISKVGGTWAYGYPKIVILFTSAEALEQINSTDLLTRVANEIAATIHADPTFGPNRMTFDSKQAIVATADSNWWSSWFPKEI